MATILSGRGRYSESPWWCSPSAFFFMSITRLIRMRCSHETRRESVQSHKAFPHFILTVMPGGLRGLVIAGVLATTMGSLGTALNSLATSYVRDFHFRWFGEPADEQGRVKVLRFGTILFATLLISVALATAWVSAETSGLAHYTNYPRDLWGHLPHLWACLWWACSRKILGERHWQSIAMGAGFIAVAYLSGRDQKASPVSSAAGDLVGPGWMPIGSSRGGFLWARPVFPVAMCFATVPAKRAPGAV